MARCRLTWGLLALAALSEAHAEDKIRIVNEGGIRDEWTLAPGTKLPVPAYPKAHEANQAEACVAIGYLLNADGTTSDFALLKAWSAAEPKRDVDGYWTEFARDASDALARWKFMPRPEVASPRPVYTVATFMFAASNQMELRKRCAIPNLAMRLAELRHDTRMSRKMAAQTIFTRLDIDPALESRYRDMQRQRDEVMRNDRKEPPPPPPQPEPPPGG